MIGKRSREVDVTPVFRPYAIIIPPKDEDGRMKWRRFSGEQIIPVLKDREPGKVMTDVPPSCRVVLCAPSGPSSARMIILA